MRLLLVSNLFPPDIGGPATYVSRLAGELHARGHSVQLLVCAEDASIVQRYPFPVRRVSRRIIMPLRLLIVLLWVLWYAPRADVVYVNGLELPAILGARLVRKRAALKVVGDFAWEYAMRHGWTNDGIDHFQSARYDGKVELVRRLEHWYARQVDRVITPSLYLKGIVTGWGVPAERVSVVYNALTSRFDGTVSREEARGAVGLVGTLVLTVARLYKWKNIDVLIRLVPDLPPESKLVIVGDGPEESALRALAARLGVADRVVFVGRVPQARVALYLRAADVFVLNTRYEGLSHTILEAMDVGLPVVATAVGGNMELIEDGFNGFLVEVDDRRQIVSAVRKLLYDRSVRESFVARSKERVRDSSWERLVDTTIGVLEGVGGRGSGVGGREDAGTRGQGDAETRRRGDAETQGQAFTARNPEPRTQNTDSLAMDPRTPHPDPLPRGEGDSPNPHLRVISIGLDPTIALADPASGQRGDSRRRQGEYAALTAGYTAIVKTSRSRAYRPHEWGGGHAILPTLSRAPWLFPMDAYRLAERSYRARGADLVVTQDPFATGLVGYRLKRRFGVPLCIQLHSDNLGSEWWMRETLLNRLMEPVGRWLIRRADTIQVVSGTIGARLIGLGVDPARIWNIMPAGGIDCQQFREAEGAELRGRLLGDRFNRLVLFVGRLVKPKDLPTLLRAASRVVRTQPDTLFLLVGEGQERARVETLRRELRLEENVALVGGVGTNEAPRYFAACDLFAMSSLYEGKARALVEAACAGRPVVTTAVSGADEIVAEGETGYIVPVRDSEALAERILLLLADPEGAREMGRRGQVLACERYDRKDNLSRIVRMWEATARAE